jgi:divalent metal cation (Fe/Co/Zn/Cd) transporter
MTNDPSEAASIVAGRRVEYLSLAWTSLEAGAGIIAGLGAASIALIGFGADSLIEIASSAILLWRLNDSERGRAREKTALKLVGACFLLLTVYVLWESIRSLIIREAPRVSYFGIGFSVLCLIVMPLLAKTKRRIALRRIVSPKQAGKKLLWAPYIFALCHWAGRRPAEVLRLEHFK